MILKEIVQNYLQYQRYKKHSFEHIKQLGYKLRRYENLPLEKWVSSYYELANKRSTHTALNHLRTLKAFFNWAIKNDFIEIDPFKNIEKPKKPLKLPQYLNEVQVAKVLNHAATLGQREKAIFYTFLHTGIRKMELLNLDSQHVILNKSLEKSYIYIENGKGQKDRLVPLSLTLWLVLNEWVKIRPKHKAFFAISESTLRRTHVKLQKKCGFKFKLHSLRDTFATQYAATRPISRLQAILGHTDIKTTAIYLSPRTKELQQDMQGFGY